MAPRILILEDNPHLGPLLQLAFELAGYEVTLTASGLTALTAVAQEPLEVVLADLQVEELSGLGVWQAVHDLARIPVIAMSASEGPWMSDAFAAGASACAPKSMQIDDLVSLVDSVLHRGEVQVVPSDVVALTDEDLQRIRAMDEDALDALPFGLIRLDDQGVVIGYNAWESAASGLPPGDVIGRRFAEVAPCTAVRSFLDATAAAKADPSTPRAIRQVFPHRDAQAVVTVRMFFDRQTQQLWLFVSKRPFRRDEAGGGSEGAPGPAVGG